MEHGVIIIGYNYYEGIKTIIQSVESQSQLPEYFVDMTLFLDDTHKNT